MWENMLRQWNPHINSSDRLGQKLSELIRKVDCSIERREYAKIIDMIHLVMSWKRAHKELCNTVHANIAAFVVTVNEALVEEAKKVIRGVTR